MAVDLRQLARQRVSDGTLRIPEHFHSFGGAGSGGMCALCDSAIRRDSLELEVELDSSTHSTYVFHVKCFWAWAAAKKYEA